MKNFEEETEEFIDSFLEVTELNLDENRKKYLKLTIDSLRQELSNCNFNSEIIVVDGGSDDGSLKWLIKQKDIITIMLENILLMKL